MKKIIAMLLATVLLLGIAACTQPAVTTAPNTTDTKPSDTTPTVPTTKPTTPATDPTLPNVTVHFDANDGTGVFDAYVIAGGGLYDVMPVPGRDGYVFSGWFTQPEGGVQVHSGMALVSNEEHTLYAHWEVKTQFTVKLDANGGRISPYNDHVLRKNGENYGTLPQPIREGYKFLGWYTQPEKGTKVKESTKFSAGTDETLYAHWEYDAQAYWQYVLENRVQQIPQCRRVVVYLERNAGYKTYIDCDFLDDAGAINPAEGLEEYKVTDEWIKSVQPYIIVKLTTSTDMALVAKTGMLRRFPDAEIYVFSTSAVSGSEKYQLYCRLYLAKLLYPEYFEDVDLDAVKKELNVKASIYY